MGMNHHDEARQVIAERMREHAKACGGHVDAGALDAFAQATWGDLAAAGLVRERSVGRDDLDPRYGRPSSEPERGEVEGWEWSTEDGVSCVVCPGCGFTFDACHTDADGGGYSCPCCGYGPRRSRAVHVEACGRCAGTGYTTTGAGDVVTCDCPQGHYEDSQDGSGE